MSFPKRKLVLTSERLRDQRAQRDNVKDLVANGNLEIPIVSFRRILDSMMDNNKMDAEAPLYLQAASEAAVVDLFKEASRLVEYENRQTVTLDDLHFAQGKRLKRSSMGSDDTESHDCFE